MFQIPPSWGGNKIYFPPLAPFKKKEGGGGPNYADYTTSSEFNQFDEEEKCKNVSPV